MNFEVMGLIMRKAFGSPTKKQVIQMMASHINEVAEPYAWPSAERLAARCELSDRTVRRVWGELAESGLIAEVGEKRFKGGAVKVWKINLKAILALPDAIASLESTLEDEEEPYDNLSGGGEHPPDTVSKTPGHSVQTPLTQCQTNNPLEISNEESTENAHARDVFGYYNQLAERRGWVVHSKLTDAIRKPLNARIEEYGAEKVIAFIDAMATLPWTSKGFAGNRDFRASLVFICRPRTFAEHFDKLVKPDAPKREPDLLSGTGEPEIDHRLDWCFELYALEKFFSGAWRGGRYGWGWRPDEPEAAGLYPDALYVKHGVPRPGTAEAGRAA